MPPGFWMRFADLSVLSLLSRELKRRHDVLLSCAIHLSVLSLLSRELSLSRRSSS